MPTRFLPAWPNLEHLKNQAKDLLKSYRAGHTPALVRFREAIPRLSAMPDDRLARLSLSLRDAQRVIAAEHGFASWSRLRTHIKRRENIQMLEVTIDQIRMSPASHGRIVVLKAKGVDRCLPIWIGSAEADSIALKLDGKEVPRPLTHDLMDSMISDLGAKVAHVIVSELREDTFIARVVVQRNGTTIERDSRPSDAIALAVRCGAPIFAEEDVLERAGVALDPQYRRAGLHGRPLAKVLSIQARRHALGGRQDTIDPGRCGSRAPGTRGHRAGGHAPRTRRRLRGARG